jgi:hypothetical protein
LQTSSSIAIINNNDVQPNKLVIAITTIAACCGST